MTPQDTRVTQHALVAMVTDPSAAAPFSDVNLLRFLRSAVVEGLAQQHLGLFRINLEGSVMPALGYGPETDLAGATEPMLVVQRLFPAGQTTVDLRAVAQVLDDDAELTGTESYLAEFTRALRKVVDDQEAFVSAGERREFAVREAARSDLVGSLSNFANLSELGRIVLAQLGGGDASALGNALGGISGAINQIGAGSAGAGIATLLGPGLGVVNDLFGLVTKFLPAVFDSKRLRRIEANLHYLQTSVHLTQQAVEQARREAAQQFQRLGEEIIANRVMLARIDEKLSQMFILLGQGLEEVSKQIKDFQSETRQHLEIVLQALTQLDANTTRFIQRELKELLDAVEHFHRETQRIVITNWLSELDGLAARVSSDDPEESRRALREFIGRIQGQPHSPMFSAVVGGASELASLPGVLTRRMVDSDPSYLQARMFGYLGAVAEAMGVTVPIQDRLDNPFATLVLTRSLVDAVRKVPKFFPDRGGREALVGSLLKEILDADFRCRRTLQTVVDSSIVALRQMVSGATADWRGYVGGVVRLGPTYDSDPSGLLGDYLESTDAYDATTGRTQLVINSVEDLGFESGRGNVVSYRLGTGVFRHRGHLDPIIYAMQTVFAARSTGPASFEISWKFDSEIRSRSQELQALHGKKVMDLNFSRDTELQLTISGTSLSMLELATEIRDATRLATNEWRGYFVQTLGADKQRPLMKYKELLGMQSGLRFALQCAGMATRGSRFAGRVSVLLDAPDVLSEQVSGLMNASGLWTPDSWGEHVQRGLGEFVRSRASIEQEQPLYLTHALDALDRFVDLWTHQVESVFVDFRSTQMVTDSAAVGLRAWIEMR
ncbi:MAG: hypothetical protein H6837_16570 [Planctomycetes bacterium]|nr:hypothetical protein [Planctomycetota bacterium]